MGNGDDLNAALERLMAERDARAADLAKLENAIEAIQAMLGASLARPESADGGAARDDRQARRIDSGRPTGTPFIRPDQFFGKSHTDAADAYLQLLGHAATVDQILDALTRGGVKVGGGDPKRVLYGELVRGTRKFVLVSPNTFGLRAFYPNLPKKEKKAAKTPKSKGQAKKPRLMLRAKPDGGNEAAQQ